MILRDRYWCANSYISSALSEKTRKASRLFFPFFDESNIIYLKVKVNLLIYLNDFTECIWRGLTHVGVNPKNMKL